jgi:hypothetical protein
VQAGARGDDRAPRARLPPGLAAAALLPERHRCALRHGQRRGRGHRVPAGAAGDGRGRAPRLALAGFRAAARGWGSSERATSAWGCGAAPGGPLPPAQPRAPAARRRPPPPDAPARAARTWSTTSARRSARRWCSSTSGSRRRTSASTCPWQTPATTTAQSSAAVCRRWVQRHGAGGTGLARAQLRGLGARFRAANSPIGPRRCLNGEECPPSRVACCAVSRLRPLSPRVCGALTPPPIPPPTPQPHPPHSPPPPHPPSPGLSARHPLPLQQPRRAVLDVPRDALRHGDPLQREH